MTSRRLLNFNVNAFSQQRRQNLKPLGSPSLVIYDDEVEETSQGAVEDQRSDDEEEVVDEKAESEAKQKNLRVLPLQDHNSQGPKVGSNVKEENKRQWQRNHDDKENGHNIFSSTRTSATSSTQFSSTRDSSEQLVPPSKIFSLARHGRYVQLKHLIREKQIPVESREANTGNTVLIIGAQNNLKRIVKLALRNRCNSG